MDKLSIFSIFRDYSSILFNLLHSSSNYFCKILFFLIFFFNFLVLFNNLHPFLQALCIKKSFLFAIFRCFFTIIDLEETLLTLLIFMLYNYFLVFSFFFFFCYFFFFILTCWLFSFCLNLLELSKFLFFYFLNIFLL